jgi:hypothetical protein
MIKVMNLVGILAAPFTTVVVGSITGVSLAVTLFAALMLAIAVILSKRGGIGEEDVKSSQTKAAA